MISLTTTTPSHTRSMPSLGGFIDTVKGYCPGRESPNQTGGRSYWKIVQRPFQLQLSIGTLASRTTLSQRADSVRKKS